MRAACLVTHRGRLTAIALAVVVAVVSMFAAAACGGTKGSTDDAYGVRTAQEQNGNAVTVELAKISFSPQGIKIKPGTTVTWINNDPVAHNVRQIESAFLSPDAMDEGVTFSFTFETPGTYKYQCTLHHPNMNGVVIVEDS